MGNNKSVFKRLSLVIRSWDIYGKNVQLYIKENEKFKSIFGSFISVIIYVLSLFILINLFISWFKLQNTTTIHSTENITVNSLLSDNHSIEYSFNHKNYYIYFAVYADLPDDEVSLSYSELNKYFKMEYVFSHDKNYISVPLNSEYCLVKDQNEFLGLENGDIMPNETNPYRQCLIEEVILGLYPDIENLSVLMSTIKYRISICQNSSENNFGCAPINEIKKIIKYVTVQATIPKSIYDFKNVSNPIHRIYKYEDYYLDWNMGKKVVSEIIPNFLFIDDGIFSDDYLLKNIDFNVDSTILDLYTREEENNILFEYNLVVSFQSEKYYIRNLKIDDVIGTLGGIISILYNIGYYICSFYNDSFLKHTLITSSFKFLGHKNMKQKKKDKLGIMKIASIFFPKKDEQNKKIRFCFLKYFWSKFRRKNEDDSYILSQKYIYEYLDINKIIQRLQDVDKLKQIVLNDDQKFFFDLIPKPEISDSKTTIRSKTTFGAEKIMKSRIKNANGNFLSKKFEKLKDDSNFISQRILVLLDEETKQMIKLKSISKSEGSKKFLN